VRGTEVYHNVPAFPPASCGAGVPRSAMRDPRLRRPGASPETAEARAPFGRLVHEVRLTCERGRWLARIVTLPRQVWTTADGRGALTFEGASAEEADRKAARFNRPRRAS
jgi:hypothetical protein